MEANIFKLKILHIGKTDDTIRFMGPEKEGGGPIPEVPYLFQNTPKKPENSKV